MLLLKKIDSQLRKKEPIEKILEHTDRVILQETHGLSEKEIALAHSIWRKLSSRRMRRGKKNT
jgi:adenine-specific DNA-methyltransferase